MAFRALSDNTNLVFSDRAFDVRGWAVKTMADKEDVGEVDDLIIDDTGSPRYLDVDLGFFQKHVLLPIGQARVDAEEEVIWVPGMSKDQFEEIPEFKHDLNALDRDYEDRLIGAYGGVFEGESFYEGPEYATSRPGFSATAGTTTGRLASMDELDDFEVADGDPDIRGWKLIGSDGAELGEVDELIVDASAMKVRYLSVDLDDDLIDGERDRHVLLPIGYARLDEDDECVFVDALETSRIAALPEFTGEVTRDYEESLTTALTSDREGFYAHPRYDAETFYGPRGLVGDEARVTLSEEELALGKRERRAGEVEIDKHVETEHVREPVSLRHEEVEIERRPASGMRAGDARIGNEEIHVPLTEEEAVVEKRPVVKEELVVRKKEVEDTEMIETDLRKEDVEIREDRDRLDGRKLR